MKEHGLNFVMWQERKDHSFSDQTIHATTVAVRVFAWLKTPISFSNRSSAWIFFGTKCALPIRRIGSPKLGVACKSKAVHESSLAPLCLLLHQLVRYCRGLLVGNITCFWRHSDFRYGPKNRYVDAETLDDKSQLSGILVSVGFQNIINKVGSEGVISLCETGKNLTPW